MCRLIGLESAVQAAGARLGRGARGEPRPARPHDLLTQPDAAHCSKVSYSNPNIYYFI